MDGLSHHVFKYEIAQQCRFILRSAAQLDETLEGESPGWTQREEEWASSGVSLWETPPLRRYETYIAMMGVTDEMVMAIWFALQGILVAAANISKLLWGSQGRGAPDRAELRSQLGMANGSPLESPSLRNDFEHLDERVERWAKTHKGPYVGRNIWHERSGMPPLIPDENPDRRFGHFDPATREVSFWTHRISLPEIIQETERLLEKLEPSPTRSGQSVAGGGQ